ncbi:HPr kinase/phosphorylase [Chelativorans intermedius]|uniref:HPr kinase/phosphorylase n=1 Tax=Chelativorans intermedius TaxID=515947 RepID=A0ABV6D8K2_9HYPH|nr:HPr kinase/phosphorylase [Chelativorans intermedius]MCT8998123.1 HPr kinase/phosphorylase [Chelativorans intermedius]
MAPANRHASLVIAGESGVLITGPSGSGKTELALALMAHCTAHGRFARLVSDDQVFLSAAAGRLIGRAPPTIAGLAEARGFGPAAIAHQSRAVVDLVVRLVAAEAAPRLHEGEEMHLQGVVVPCLELAARRTQGAVFAVAARLGLPPFS